MEVLIPTQRQPFVPIFTRGKCRRRHKNKDTWYKGGFYPQITSKPGRMVHVYKVADTVPFLPDPTQILIFNFENKKHFGSTLSPDFNNY